MFGIEFIAAAIGIAAGEQRERDALLEQLRRQGGTNCPNETRVRDVTPKPKQLPPPDAATKGEP